MLTSGPVAAIVIMLAAMIIFYFLIDNWSPALGFWDNVFTGQIQLMQFRVSYLWVLAGATGVICAAVISLIFSRGHSTSLEHRRERRWPWQD